MKPEKNIGKIMLFIAGFIVSIWANLIFQQEPIIQFIIVIISSLIFILGGGLYLYFSNPIKRIVRILQDYEEQKDDEKKEIEMTQELGNLFPKLTRVGFGITDNGNLVKDRFFQIHLTRSSPGSVIHKFYIEDLESDLQYFSEKYPDQQKQNNDINALNNFIEYIKEKK